MHATVLFVEDNADLRENAALVLGLEGYKVKVARDGREALDILEAGFLPHVIVSDIMMPRMDGYEFFDAVRQRNDLKAIPFIFLTARGSRREVSFAKSLGADDYLIKPFDPEEFLIAIQNKLQRTADIREQVLESMDDTRRSLVQMLSHELKTPLMYVTGGFDMLADELTRQAQLPVTGDMQLSLDLIRDGAQRLTRLAEQTVLYSQVVSGYINQEIDTGSQYHDLAQLVNEALTQLGRLSREKNAAIQCAMPADQLVAVQGVGYLLVWAISEIIRNAIQYAPAGTPIQVTVTQQDGSGVLTVVDRGQGIKPEDIAQIWNILSQSERERTEQQGIGMGLPITKGIISAHGGTIVLDSTLGQGTQVTLRLPLTVFP